MKCEDKKLKLALIRILNTLSMVFVTFMNPLATSGEKMGLALKVCHCSFQVPSYLGSTHLNIPIGYWEKSCSWCQYKSIVSNLIRTCVSPVIFLLLNSNPSKSASPINCAHVDVKYTTILCPFCLTVDEVFVFQGEFGCVGTTGEELPQF